MNARIAALALVAGSVACADQCKEEAPAVHIDVSASTAVATTVKSLDVILTVDGEQRGKVFEVERTIADGATSIGVELDPALTEAVSVHVEVRAFGGANGGGALVALGSADLEAAPDACNRAQVALGLNGADAGFPDALPADVLPIDALPTDAPALDASDADVAVDPDTGIHDVEVAPDVDAGVPDVGPDPDATTPDTGTGNCGNGTIDTSEVCDGTNLGGRTCFELGLFSGLPVCSARCDSIDFGSCSNPLNSATELANAVATAVRTPGHETIVVDSDQIELPARLTIDECDPTCPNGADGLTLVARNGGTTIEGSGIRIVSGNNVVQGFEFSGVEQPLELRATRGANSGGNIVRGLRIRSGGEHFETGIEVDSSDNQILANWIESTSSEAPAAGILVTAGARNIIAMNVIRGDFLAGIHVEDVASGSGATETTRLDQNTISITGLGQALVLLNSENLCVRSNVFLGTRTSTAVQVSDTGLGSDCGIPSGSNDWFGFARNCRGNDCALCQAGPLCEQNRDPQFNAGMCLTAGSALIDGGDDLGYDLVDGSASTFNGAAPDVGALESSSSRRFGRLNSSCP